MASLRAKPVTLTLRHSNFPLLPELWSRRRESNPLGRITRAAGGLHTAASLLLEPPEGIEPSSASYQEAV